MVLAASSVFTCRWARCPLNRIYKHALGIELSQVAALGDGQNDMEMLREAGLGIAMGNASDGVKSAADWITGTNDEDGVAQAVGRLVSNGLV